MGKNPGQVADSSREVMMAENKKGNAAIIHFPDQESWRHIEMSSHTLLVPFLFSQPLLRSVEQERKRSQTLVSTPLGPSVFSLRPNGCATASDQETPSPAR